LIIAAVLIILFFYGGTFLQNIFLDYGEKFKNFEEGHPVFQLFIFVALAAMSVVFGPFTSAPIVPFGVVVWGMWGAFALLMAGWLIGNSIAYLIGYYLGFPLVKRLVSEKKLNEWMNFISGKVDSKFVFLFRLAAPAEVGYVFGILKYSFLKYFVIVFLAEIPFGLILLCGGQAFIENNWFLLWLMVGLTALIIFLSSLFLKRR